MAESFLSIDPSTEQVISTFSYANKKAIDVALNEAQETFLANKQLPMGQRADFLRAIAQDLEQNALEYASVMAQEMGKPINQGEQEIKKCAWVCRFYAEKGQEFLAEDIRPSDAKLSKVQHDPLGLILAIMPWNFPFWQVFRVAAPNIMAGNAIILKHAIATPQCALAIEKLFRNHARSLLRSLFLTHEDVPQVIADLRVKGVTLTGSNKAGIEVAQLAGRYLKPCVLELGGSDPFIVFPDADLENATTVGVTARCLNNGQSCVAAKRFIIHKDISKDFEDIFVKKMNTQIIGNPLDRNVNIGPLVTKAQLLKLHEQVVDAKNKGAKILCGGEIKPGSGFFYSPTVITNVTRDMQVWREETFGPLAALRQFSTDDEALLMANDTSFGLGASIWTNDQKRIERFSRDLESGMVFINDMVKSDPRFPFGGIKESGLGRELGSEGIKSFINIKTIWQV